MVTPDPRIDALGVHWPLTPVNRKFFQDILDIAAAADFSAGVVRVDTEDPAVVERVARALYGAEGGKGWPPMKDTSLYVSDARAVIAALLEAT